MGEKQNGRRKATEPLSPTFLPSTTLSVSREIAQQKETAPWSSPLKQNQNKMKMLIQCCTKELQREDVSTWNPCSYYLLAEGGCHALEELETSLSFISSSVKTEDKQTQPTNRKYGHVAMLRIRRFLKIGGKNVGEWQGQEMQRESKAIQCLFCCWSSPWSRMIFNPGRMEQTWGLGATDE